MSKTSLVIAIMFIFILLPMKFIAQQLPDDYQTKSASEKQALLWNNVEKTAYKKLPVQGPSGLDMANLLNVNYLTKSISNESDEMPSKRKRLIHTYGSVAKIIYTPISSTPAFTGLFSSVVPCIIRASVVKYDPKNLMPGIAIKFLVDGHPSLNIHALHNIDGQGKNYDYFANPFTNIIPPPTSPTMRTILDVFTKAARTFTSDGSAMKVSVDAFAKINADGSLAANPHAPEQIYFYPTTEVTHDSKDNRDFRIKLSELPVGTKLFDVFVNNPADKNNPLLIGKITLESKFIASQYGDEIIFFQHLVK
jgi:hypothetical protein